MTLDAATDIATAGFTLSTSGTGALNFASTGQVTFAGNVDATNGLDVTNANLTVGGANFSVAPATGNITTAGDLAVNGDDITSDGTLGVLAATGLNLQATTGTVTLDSIAASQIINIGASNVARTVNIGTGTGADTINIGTGGTTADTIVIGSTLAGTSLTLNDDNWNITGGGLANFVSIGAATPGTGAFTTLTAHGNNVCESTGTNCPSIGSSGGKWQESSGAISPINETWDVLIGSTATSSAKIGFININSGTPTINLANQASNIAIIDATANALQIIEGTNPYLAITTTNGSENVSFGNTTTNPSYSFLGSGTAAFSGGVTVGTDLSVSSGITTFGTAVSDGTVEASKFCTGDGETNCVTDFNSI